ncbi:MAG TPA: hypothetical protein VIR98_01555 [Candidatus Paceibacterota bacterium]|jgi:hypothetical protein
MKFLQAGILTAIAFTISAGAASAATLDATLDLNAKATTSTGSSSGIVGELETVTVGRSDIQDNVGMVVEPGSVSTTADLDAYARAVVKDDENVSKVEASADKVSVWYKEHGEFLGFIPVAVRTRATIYADGTVEIDRPWYDVLTTGKNEDAIKADIEATAGTIVRASGSGEFSSNLQARLVNAVRSVMKAHYEAGVTASSLEDIEVGY